MRAHKDPYNRRLWRVGAVCAALFFPTMLYLFLRACTQNIYEVPTYYQNSLSAARPSECEPMTFPYSVWMTDEHLTEWINPNADLHLICYADEKALAQIAKNKPPQILLQIYQLSTDYHVHNSEEWKHVSLSTKDLQRLRDCDLLVPIGMQQQNQTAWAVLVDVKGHIRSYTNPSTLKGRRQILNELRIFARE